MFLAGERADPDTIKWAENLLKVPVIDHWWQTETSWAISSNCTGIEMMETKYGSACKAVPGYDVKIIKPDQSLAKPNDCLLYTSPSPRDVEESRMPSSA